MPFRAPEPEQLEKKYQEPEPLGKKSGAEAAKKKPGSPSLIFLPGIPAGIDSPVPRIIIRSLAPTYIGLETNAAPT